MLRPTLSIRREFSWRLFFLLWIAALIATIALIPYALTLQKPTLQKINLPMPLYQIILIQLLANSVFLGLLIGGGLYFATRIGLGLPFLEKRIRGIHLPEKFRQIVFLSIGVGLLSAFLIFALDEFVFDVQFKSAGIEIPESIEPEAWKGFLAAFYGGITEELLLRLFFLTFFAWIGTFLAHTADERPTLIVLWISNILAALIFGLGHLPATAAAGLPLNALVVSRGLILNGAAGLAFGWLYFTYGLESAMIAHFSADIVLHGFSAML